MIDGIKAVTFQGSTHNGPSPHRDTLRYVVHIPFRATDYSVPSDAFDPTAPHTWLDLEISVDSLTHLVYEARKFTESRGLHIITSGAAEYVLVGFTLFTECLVRIPDELPEYRHHIFIHAHSVRVCGVVPIFVGSMEGICFLPKLEPDRIVTPINDRGMLVKAHMEAVSRNVLTMGVHAQRSTEYKQGVFEALRLTCEGLGIKNPQDL